MATTEDVVRIAIEETPRYENAPTTGAYEIASDTYDLPVQSVLLNGAPTHLDRSDEVRGTEGGPPQAIDGYEPAGTLAMRCYVNSLPFLLEVGGFVGTPTPGAGTDELQTITITGTPTGGSMTLTWTPPGGTPATTGPIPYNATADVVKLKLEKAFGRGNFVVTGGPFPGTPIAVTFGGDYAATNVAAMTKTDSFSGGSAPASAIVTTTPGAAGAVLDPDGNGITTGATKWVFDKRGGVQAASLQMLLCYADEGFWFKGQGFGLASLGLNAEGALTGDMAGLVVDRLDVDPNITPNYDDVSILPARRGDITLDWETGGGTLSDFSVGITNPLVRQRTMGLAQSSFFPDKLEHGDDKVRLTGTIPMHSVTTVDWDSLMDARTFACTARWKLRGNFIGATGQPFGIWIEMPACQYIGGGIDPMANKRRFGGSFDWWAAMDSSAGYDAKITVIAGTDAIRTGIT